MKAIILEGVNGSGKSTLAEALKEEFDLPIYHPGSDAGSEPAALWNAMEQAIMVRDAPFILDRCTPISRMVYQMEMTQEHLVCLMSILACMHEYCVIVYCNGAGKFSNKPYYPPGHFEEICRMHKVYRAEYDELFSAVPHIKYNWLEESVDNFIIRLRQQEGWIDAANDSV